MSLAALMAFYKANEALIFKLLLVISEYLGANPKIKSNGIVSLILLQVQSALKNDKTKDSTH